MDFSNLANKRFLIPAMAIAGGAAAIKGLLGIGQAVAGGIKMRKALRNRPDYTIPEEYQQNVAMADNLMNLGMPREQYLAQLQGINRNQSFGLRMLGDRRSALAGVGNLVQQSNDAQLNLNAADATMRRDSKFRATGMKMNANYQLGMQKLAKQQWDKFNPYLAKLNQAQGLIGAGMQNIGGALDMGAMLAMSENGGGTKPTKTPQYF